MTFHIEDRKGLTVNPPEIDEATGQVIGEPQVYSFEEKHEFFRNSEPDNELPFFDPDDIDSIDPDNQPPSIEQRLADTHEYIYNAEVYVDPEVANAIASADIEDSDAATVVKYQAYKFFNGDISKSEAISNAIESGIDPDELMAAFYALDNYFNPIDE